MRNIDTWIWFAIVWVAIFFNCEKPVSPIVSPEKITAEDYEPANRTDDYDIRWTCEEGHGYQSRDGWTSFDFIEDDCARFTIKNNDIYTVLWYNKDGFKKTVIINAIDGSFTESTIK